MSENVLTAEFPMRVDYRGKKWTIGVLTLVASLSSIHERLWQDLVVVFIGNAVKTFLVVGFVFILFHRMVTRRLGSLTAAIHKLDLEGQGHDTTDLVFRDIADKPLAERDEIDQIAIALQDMHSNLISSH